jgi:hypothetical protein
MDFQNEITSRSWKKKFLSEIISRLKVSEDEKEMYQLCIEVLEDDDFEMFYLKIRSELTQTESEYQGQISLFTQHYL